jgi:hypothetical protein
LRNRIGLNQKLLLSLEKYDAEGRNIRTADEICDP